jgi:hypothetical protein
MERHAMNINTRLSNIEKKLSPSQNLIVRFANGDGTYPEQEDDRRERRKVIVISSPGVDCETLRGWAK